MTVTLHCFPFAGGGAQMVRGWQELAGDAIAIRMVELPGRDAAWNQTPLRSHAAMRRHLRSTLFEELEEPFAFYGHSMGAMIAFEAIRELRRLDRPLPAGLFVSAAAAPQFGPPRPTDHLDEAGFINRLREIGGTPEEVLADRDLLEFLLPRVRADFTLAESFRYVDEPPLPVPISAWGGHADSYPEHKIAGWAQQTCARSRVRMIDGGHFFIRGHEREVLSALIDDLAAVRPPALVG